MTLKLREGDVVYDKQLGENAVILREHGFFSYFLDFNGFISAIPRKRHELKLIRRYEPEIANKSLVDREVVAVVSRPEKQIKAGDRGRIEAILESGNELYYEFVRSHDGYTTGLRSDEFEVIRAGDYLAAAIKEKKERAAAERKQYEEATKKPASNIIEEQAETIRHLENEIKVLKVQLAERADIERISRGTEELVWTAVITTEGSREGTEREHVIRFATHSRRFDEVRKELNIAAVVLLGKDTFFSVEKVEIIGNGKTGA